MRHPVFLPVALAALLAAPGCLSPGGERQERSRIETLEGPGSQMSDAQLRLEVMRFADDFSAGLYGASERLKAATDDTRKRFVAQVLLVHTYVDLVDIAAGQDAEINLLDMMIHTVLLRIVLEEHWIPEELGDAGRFLLDRTRVAEQEVWAIGALLLDEQSLNSLRVMAEAWRGRYPERNLISGIRFNDFTTELDEDDRQRAVAVEAELLAAISAAREVELAAERVLFTVGHLPSLLRMQAGLAYYELIRQTEVRQFLDGYEALVRTVDSWPEDVAAERRAAIEQALAGVTAQREALMASLEQARPVLTELRETLEAGTALIEGGNVLAGRLRLGESQVEPFDIVPYGETAAEVTRASEQMARTLAALQGLLDSEEASTTLPELTAAADGLLMRSFWLLLALVAASAIIVVGAGIGYRMLAARLSQPHGPSPSVEDPQGS